MQVPTFLASFFSGVNCGESGDGAETVSAASAAAVASEEICL
jgi:hypothetical protein